MNTKKTAGEQDEKSGNSSKPEGKARYRRWRMPAGALLCLLGLMLAARNARAETLTYMSPHPIPTTDLNGASVTMGFISWPGRIIAVRVTLHNVTHTFPDDYDILLVGPGGQRTILMSDCGGGLSLNDVTLTFSDTAASSLPDSTQITSGTYRPSNYSGDGPNDQVLGFPPRSYSSSLAVFNNTIPTGDWTLYVQDDAGGNVGSIAGGWTLEIDTAAFPAISPGLTIPGTGTSGPANLYPSPINVAGILTNIRKMRVTLWVSHTRPDDVDIMLVGPGGQNAIIMSDVGGDEDTQPNFHVTFDDTYAIGLPDEGPLPQWGTFAPSNIGTGDVFPAPAPAPAGTSTFSVFNNTSPNGTWNLFVVDDEEDDIGGSDIWILDFDLQPTVLANISSRMRVETGDNVLIGGFIVTGGASKKVLLRAIGPSLPVAGALSNPTLELRDGSGGLIWFNDNWHDGAQGFPSQEAEIIATGLAPTNNGEAAIVVTLPANNHQYTAIVRGLNDTTGIGLVEAYDLAPTVNSKLGNISTRGLVQTGDNVMIAGVIVQGEFSQRVIVRALGPSLPVPGALANPTLELRDGNGALIGSNDNWRDLQEADVIASVPLTNELESAIVATLPAAGASYTAIVRGANGATGVALVEVYALN